MDDRLSSTSTIPIVQSGRGEDRNRRRRGHDTSVLERGALACEAIQRAEELTASYRQELDSTRVRLGRSEDFVKELLARKTGESTAIPPNLPPDIFAAELLKRDALVNKWSESYQRLVDASAAERTERKAERARLEADIRRLERRADRIYNETRDRDRDRDRERAQRHHRTTPDTALLEARRERDDARRALDQARADLATANLTARTDADQARADLAAAKLTARNDVNYYIHQANKHRSAELDAQQLLLDQRQLVLELRAQLQQADPPTPPIPTPGILHDPGLPGTGPAAPADDFLDSAAFSIAHQHTSALDGLAGFSPSPRTSPSRDFRTRRSSSPSDSQSSSSRT